MSFQNIPTVSSQVLTYLRKHRKWTGRGELERVVTGHNGDSVSRILRKMAVNGDIKVDYKKVVPRLRPLVFYRI